MSCLNLLRYLTVNTGEMARKYIRDPTLLRFIDLECFIWSTVSADMTPFINTGAHYLRTSTRKEFVSILCVRLRVCAR